MQLTSIALDHLSISAVNMRHTHRPPDVSDILPSIKARGILVPLLVRPNCNPGHYEIVAGRRRYFAAVQAIADSGTVQPDPVNDRSDGDEPAPPPISFTELPCAILDVSDDAAALEASLIENIARLNPSELEQYETFVRLTKAGRSIAQIALTFGISDRQVRQRLALGNLHPRIRKLYAHGEIDNESLQLLTMGSKAQQSAWLRLHDSEDECAATGRSLKQWLLGGATIPLKNALFRDEDYSGAIITDLFGDEVYYGDIDQFWRLQDAMIEAHAAGLREAGWHSVIILERGERFAYWDHVKHPKSKGGHAYVVVGHDGTVEEQLGYLTIREARKQASGSEADKRASPAKPDMTAPMANYIALHRHAAVRLEVTAHTGLALRLACVWLLTGTPQWPAKAEPQRTQGKAIQSSLECSPAQALFNRQRGEIIALLGLEHVADHPLTGSIDASDSAAVLGRLAQLDDSAVMGIFALLVAEGMSVSDPLIDGIGAAHHVLARTHWQPDAAFFELLRDKATINTMLAEVAGPSIAASNARETGKAQKMILQDCLEGLNGRTANTDWVRSG